MPLTPGDQAPNFTAPTETGEKISLSDYKGDYIILYFYPKDDTPGCTTEACAFRDHRDVFESLNARIIGVSKDSVEKHEKFKNKYALPFPLVSDENGTICEEYGVWREKKMYGRTFMGIERTTFLIAPDGKIAAIWPKVKVAKHIDEIRQELENLHTGTI